MDLAFGHAVATARRRTGHRFHEFLDLYPFWAFISQRTNAKKVSLNYIAPPSKSAARGGSRGQGSGEAFPEYLARFYSTFEKGSWHRFPEAFAVVAVADKSQLLQTASSASILLVKNHGWWRQLERLLSTAAESSKGAQEKEDGEEDGRPEALRCVMDLLADASNVSKALVAVRHARCTDCGAYDAHAAATVAAAAAVANVETDDDDAAACKLCKVCWEIYQITVQEQQVNELPSAEYICLKNDLGPYFLGQRRQRWVLNNLSEEEWMEVELRPAGVLLIRNGGAGAWTCPSSGADRQKLVLHLPHLPGGKCIDSVEMRYVTGRAIFFFG